MRTPTNTDKLIHESAKELGLLKDPLDLLRLSTALGSAGLIELMERAGQAELVESEVLPTQVSPTNRDLMVSWGLEFGDPVEGDPLFTQVKLPQGWSKRKTDHDMWSEVLDDKGRPRIRVFYKAAYYDRRAYMSANCRFSVSAYGEIDGQPDLARGEVRDADGSIVFATETVTAFAGDYQTRDRLGQMAKDWLNEHYPQWESEGAYWDT